mgnify:CR=1 FL=1
MKDLIRREFSLQITLGEYNSSRLLATEILSGKQFRRLRRKGLITI